MIENKKIALIHDHLAQDGGAEKVLKVLADMFPKAPIYTLLYEEEQVNKYFKGREIKTSIIQRLPGGVKHYQWYVSLMPMAVEFFDLSDFDIVISDASAFAKGIITKPDTLHICYCHAPTRYLWDYTHQYINELSYNKYLKKVISLILNKIRIWDFVAAQRVDLFIANSQTVQKRIQKYYRRSSEVIYPPVELNKFKISTELGDYFLIGGRLAPYKRVDIVIEAFKKMPDKKLKIFGDGVDLKRLQNLADNVANIKFLGRVDENKKAELYSQCLAFINPQEEDFGITVIEAMASGRPVIAYKKGGATETVINEKTGLFFNKQSNESLIEVIKNFTKINFNPEEIKKQAENFSEATFKEKMFNFINKNL
jgi:glycosyltransferase involved in cell wall biosynthesis